MVWEDKIGVNGLILEYEYKDGHFVEMVARVWKQFQIHVLCTQYIVYAKQLAHWIFDSGIGGLTLAHAITELMPNEPIIYFGDTAHLPYGDKSATAIQAYSVKICNLLLEKNCKLILIACNSASAAAYDLVKAYVGTKAIVVNVIDPVIHFLEQNRAGKTLGLIGTKQTINSSIYSQKRRPWERIFTLNL